MPKFTKQVEFNAYQFNPKQLRGLDDYDIEDIIITALEISEDIKSAFVTEAGKLDVVFYTYGKENTKEWFELNPGDWLTITDCGDFTVITDEKFREFASPVQ